MPPTTDSRPPLSPTDKARGQRLLLWCLLPLACPIGLSLLLVLQAHWQPLPTLAPGEGWRLAGPGALAALLTWLLVRRHTRRIAPTADWRRAAAVLSLVTSVLGMPVWTLGVMQWVNGRFPHSLQITRMPLLGLSTSPKKHSREPYHWAHLPGDNSQGLPAGKYLIDSGHHASWTLQAPTHVHLHHARGLLGAQVVAGLGD